MKIARSRIPVIAALLIFLIPASVKAEKIDLLCIASPKDQSLSYDIDTSLYAVTHGSERGSDVRIDKYNISFVLPGPGATVYNHVINRTTGRMTVASKDIVFNSEYICDKNKPRF